MTAAEKPQIERFKKAAREAGTNMSKEEFGRVIGGMATPAPSAAEGKPSHCLCGCGEAVISNSKFLLGHDQKLRVAFEDTVGRLEALKELVEIHIRRPINSDP